MASPSYTYSLTNGTTADATQVMQDFNDILAGVTDGTKDLSINALTVAGTATLNGNINLGNASGDDLTITASLASSIPIKTTNAFDIGATTLGLRKIYFGNAGASTSINLASVASIGASRSYTIPDVAGAGVLKVGLGQLTTSSAAYVILDNDGYDTFLFSTGASQRTCTLPAVANNSGRVIRLAKTDSGAGTVLIDTPGSETIDGSAQNVLNAQYSFIDLVSDGTNWTVLNVYDYIKQKASGTITGTGNLFFDVGAGIAVSSGNWMVSAVLRFDRATATAICSINTFLGTTTGNVSTSALTDSPATQSIDLGTGVSATSWSTISSTMPPSRYNITSTTTVFHKGLYNISVNGSNDFAYGGYIVFQRII